MKYYDIRSAADTVDFLIYGPIGYVDEDGDGITAKIVAEAIKGRPVRQINVSINSTGGGVFDGVAIYNVLAQSKAKVVVSIDGVALSIASVIAMAGDEIRIAENGLMMIHSASGMTFGNADDHESMLEMLRKTDEQIVTTYAARTGLNPVQVREWMKAETWFDAEQAIEFGFATEVIEAKKIAACGDLSKYQNVPDALRQEFTRKDQVMTTAQETQPVATLEQAPKPATIAELKRDFPKSTAEWREKMIEGSVTLPDAAGFWIAEQDKVIAKQDEALKAEQAKVAKAEKASQEPGVETQGAGASESESTSDPVAVWDEAVQGHIKAGMTKAAAIVKITAENPELHEAYIAAYNEQHGRGARQLHSVG